MSDLYGLAREASEAHGETNDCAVMTLSVLTGLSYDKALLALSLLGRERRKGTP